MCKLVCQVPQQLLLRLLLPHHGGHLLAQVAHDQDVDLRRTHTLHKLVHLPAADALSSALAAMRKVSTLESVHLSYHDKVPRTW